MIAYIVAFLGGVLTIVSPCILPVLPFVFARADRPFLSNGLPLLIGMAAAFAVIATLAAVGGNWVVEANVYGRYIAMALLAVFGLTLLFPSLSERLTQPLVTLGNRLSQSTAGNDDHPRGAVASSLVLGVATGLLWAPCAGPILGLILTGAALNGANAQTTLLLLAYALGAATSLGLALLAGGKVFAAMKRSLGVGEIVRRGLGVLVLAAVVVIGLGWDTGFLTRLSVTATNSVEQKLIGALRPEQSTPKGAGGAMMSQNGAAPDTKAPSSETLGVEGPMPSLEGANDWLNSTPLTKEGLKGKVVLIDFWTYSCINCLRAIPYVRAWAEKYKNDGLVVIGVHTPEFAFERRIDNVKQAAATLKIDYPIAIDNDYKIWRAFENNYWPAHFFIDAEGRIRHHHFGEGSYDESERVIQQLLKEAGQTHIANDVVDVKLAGIEASSQVQDVQSPETYLGTMRGQNFISPGGAIQDQPRDYQPGSPRLNEWGLSGNWSVGLERATANAPGAGIVYRFHARDLHLVLAAPPSGQAVRFRVKIDGHAPGDDHGVDTDAQGDGTVTDQRLYQLIRQKGAITDHLFEIEFLDPGVQAYAFTFG
ncbi:MULTISPECIES: cytochrome c biogenesis protein DipZ [unclassified Beijerinckia]|uniref:cytochrome c biogenesis protein DipZ n=1 Tax=unclassified Beijerinckia TaxID=2638183 RepID=UPI0008966CFA|nr:MULTISPECIES: cytochrome c biogenesis protein DipZ [unclassified Beijerinckia]MDH7797530.1 cytochrome c biogenesis protein CcdA/thiol-disulfide isomerase/thioredoxin [Beijerinckia sp. GAS462]SEC89328.1 Cytochrome c biogenesis protein CcdA [Beijerinckia sp. 28-YEA-48]